MKNERSAISTVDAYIAGFDGKVRTVLKKLRTTIREAAPEATETISYQMPAYKQNGILVYFAAFRDHISLFPTASGIEAFRERLGPWEISKGTIRFPFETDLPYDLIAEIVRFRVEVNGRIRKKK